MIEKYVRLQLSQQTTSKELMKFTAKNHTCTISKSSGWYEYTVFNAEGENVLSGHWNPSEEFCLKQVNRFIASLPEVEIVPEVAAEVAAEESFPKFNRFALVGDSIKWKKAGFTITATLHADSDSKPEDSECYDEDDILLFNLDQWFYVGIVLSVSRNDVMILDNASSIWGVECNFPGNDNSYLADCALDLEDEAIKAAEVQREVMIKALQD